MSTRALQRRYSARHPLPATLSSLLAARTPSLTRYLQFANAFGSCIAFLVICTNQLEPVLSEVSVVADGTSIFERRALITVVVSCICLPMLYIDSVAPLEPLATFSVVAIQFLVVVILWGTCACTRRQLRVHNPPLCHPPPPPPPSIPPSPHSSIPILIHHC